MYGTINSELTLSSLYGMFQIKARTIPFWISRVERVYKLYILVLFYQIIKGVKWFNGVDKFLFTGL